MLKMLQNAFSCFVCMLRRWLRRAEGYLSRIWNFCIIIILTAVCCSANKYKTHNYNRVVRELFEQPKLRVVFAHIDPTRARVAFPNNNFSV